MTELTPKEKAKEIYFKMMEHSFGGDSEQAKQCSLIAVGLLINCTHSSDIVKSNIATGETAKYCYEYWQQVKTEIEKL